MRGFTLVELLVALAIGAMLVAIAPPAFDKLRESAQYRDTVRSMLADLRQARSAALASGTEVQFFIDLGQRSYGVGTRTTAQLPASLQIRATTASGGAEAAAITSIRFLPSGGASGGRIDILRASGSGTRLHVDWLSGRVSQEVL